MLAFSKPYFADANVDWVRKKIANLSTVFLKEHKKIEGSKRSGSASDQVYTPNLWYYNELLFLMEKEPQNQSLVIMSAQESAAVDEEGEASSLTLMQTTTADDTTQDPSLQTENQEPTPSCSTSNPPPKKRSRKTTNAEQEDFITQAKKALNNPPDRIEDYAGYLSKTLRELSKEQRLECERITAKMFYLAQQGLLTPDTKPVRTGSSSSGLTPPSDLLPTSYSSASTQPAHQPTYPPASYQPAPQPTYPPASYQPTPQLTYPSASEKPAQQPIYPSASSHPGSQTSFPSTIFSSLLEDEAENSRFWPL